MPGRPPSPDSTRAGKSRAYACEPVSSTENRRHKCFSYPPPTGENPDELILSASDIVARTTCEFAAVRKLDVLLKRLPAVVQEADAMADLTAALGDKHEAKVLGLLREEYGVSRVYQGCFFADGFTAAPTS